MSLARRLTDTDAKVRILALFHSQRESELTLEEIEDCVDLPLAELEMAAEDLVKLGLLRDGPSYSLDEDRDREIQRELGGEMRANMLESLEMSWADSRRPTGVDLMDGMVEGDFPAPASYLILADPECDKEVLCQQLAAGCCSMGETVAYVVTDQDPEDVKSGIASMLGYRSGRILLFDMFSPQGQLSSPVEFSEHPEKLTDVSIALAKLLDEKVGLMIVDSVSTLVDVNGVDVTIQFMKSLSVRSKRKGCSLFFTLNRKAYETAVIARFQALADGVIELKAEEDLYRGITRSIRISKLTGTRFDSRWNEYDVSQDRGFVRLSSY